MGTDIGLDTEDIQLILERCLGTKDAVYISHTTSPFSKEAEGYLSDQMALTITYENNGSTNTKSFFLKVLLKDAQFLTELSTTMDVFPSEKFVYMVLFEEFKKLGHCLSFAPKCYLAKDDLLVLEDLCSEGFHNSKEPFFDVEHCRAFLEVLARCHGQSMAYEAMKSKQIGKKYRLVDEYPNEFREKFFSNDAKSPTMLYLASALQTIRDLIDELEDGLLDKAELKRQVTEELKSNAFQHPLLKKYDLCLVHGDLWSNNILYRYDGDKVKDCRVIDYQVFRYSFPGYDLVHFFYANTTLDFRRTHFKDLVKFYHQCLAAVLGNYQIDIQQLVTYQDLMDSITLIAPAAKVFTVNDVALTNLPKDLIFKEMEQNPNIFRDVLTKLRSKYVIPVFRENPQFQEYVINELLDLRDTVIAKSLYLKNVTNTADQ